MPVTRQCQLLHLPRSTAYYQPVPWITPWHIDVMHRIDTIYTKYPTFGSRRMKGQLKRWYDLKVSRKLVRKLMQVMGLEAIYQRPDTSKLHPDHKVFRVFECNILIFADTFSVIRLCCITPDSGTPAFFPENFRQ